MGTKHQGNIDKLTALCHAHREVVQQVKEKTTAAVKKKINRQQAKEAMHLSRHRCDRRGGRATALIAVQENHVN